MALIAGVLQATSLPFIFAATAIGVQIGVVTQASVVALIAADPLSVIVFPLLGLSLPRHQEQAESGQSAGATSHAHAGNAGPLGRGRAAVCPWKSEGRARHVIPTTDGLDTVTLVSSDQEFQATFVPSAGRVCCSLRHHGEELLAQRDGVRAYFERGSTMGIPLLHPWANRLAGFAYGAHSVVELTKASPLLELDDNGLPIHGVVPRELPWELVERGAEHAAQRLRAQMRGDEPRLLAIFPFSHRLELDAGFSARR